MFTWFKKKKSELDTFVAILHKKESYTVDLETVRKVFTLVAQYPINPEDALLIRLNSLILYRSYRDLHECLEDCNNQIDEKGELRENINRGVSAQPMKLDTWLVSKDNYRIDYTVFINDFSLLIEKHVALLESRKSELSRAKYSALEYSLYTLHYDILAIAENHLLYVHKNQPH